MTSNRYKIGGTWNPRPETPESLGRRMMATLDGLTDVSPYFTEWWFTNLDVDIEALIESGLDPDEIISRAGSPQPFDEVRTQMTAIVERGVRRGDDREPEPAGGYGISAFNFDGENEPPYGAVVSAHGGGIVDPRAGLRFAELETAENPDPAIVSYPIFRAALKALASAWEVDYAHAYSKDLRRLWRQPDALTLDLAWMTWLSPRLAQNIAPPGNAVVERTADGGLLLIAAEETFDVANPRHMAAARSIATCLAELNARFDR